MVNHPCLKCGEIFNKKSTFVNHTNRKNSCIKITPEISQYTPKIHQTIPEIIVIKETNELKSSSNANNKKFCCEFCDQYFSRKFCLDRHLDGRCKIIKTKDDNKNEIKQKFEEINKDNKLELLLNQNKELNNLLKLSIKQIPQINKNIRKLEKNIPNSNLEISNQLVNKIIEKEKKIDQMDNEINLINEMMGNNDKQKIQGKISIIDDTICKNNINDNINEFDNKPINLILNNQIIQFREIDNYINATQLCKAGGKKLSHWINLDNTKELINILASNAGIPALDLIDKKVGGNHNGTWIHPDLAIQLAQWLSPQFSIQVSCWIRQLFTTGNVSINLQILKQKENIIKDCEKRIKILEDLTLKRHKRTKYPESNVVYIVQDPDNINDRKYVIGSAKDLTVRLSTYNKGSEFEVIYYKGFETEELMEQAEKIVLLKLRKYQEQANRDRFVLPIDKDIKLFTNAIDEAWKYFN
jgi:hypothetical protein